MIKGQSDLTPRWVDDVVVDRVLAGHRVGRRLHEAERVEVARRVLAAGDGFNRVMSLLKCSGDLAKRLIADTHRPPGRVSS